MGTIKWTVGDWVVYRKQKTGPSPGPRARSVSPNSKGEDYNYLVDKYWVVDAISPDGKLHLRTRRGKLNTVEADDPRLRRPKIWERWFLSHRFPDKKTE